MKRFLFLLTILTLMLSICPMPFSVARAADIPENNSGAVLCPPDVYLQTPDDCAPLGPSQYLTEMASMGLELPLRPLQYSHPDVTLSNLPYLYYKVDSTGTGFYSSLDGAIAHVGASRLLSPGKTMYVVYTGVTDTGKGVYFQLPSGEWMPGDGSRVSVPSVFPGLEIHATPRNSFGWVIQPTGVRHDPNFLPFNPPIRQLQLHEIVQIYYMEKIEGYDWYLIGPDEWVMGRDVAAAIPNTTPPPGVTDNRWIDVNLEKQTLTVYENGQLVYATIISTGVEKFWTRPGVFQIYKKKDLETMQGSFEANRSDFYYLENVPWTMYFDKARALHGAYWHTKFGYNASHGCVNLSPGDAHWLFNWAKEGDWVYVHDPSGKTPTDPAIYGEGGA